MKVVDAFEYKRTKEKMKELELFLSQLDTISDILYNSMNKKGVWDLLMHVEEIRIENYVLYYEYKRILNKGKDNVK